MLFIRKTTPTVVVRDDSAIRAEAAMLAEERGKASATVAALGVLAVVVLLMLVGYFAWWAPMSAAQANQPPAVQHETIIERPTQPTAPTIINPPTVIHEEHIVPVPTPNTNDNTGAMDDTSGAASDTSGADTASGNDTSNDVGSGDTSSDVVPPQ
jgi:hypothetical protein